MRYRTQFEPKSDGHLWFVRKLLLMVEEHQKLIDEGLLASFGTDKGTQSRG